MKFLYRAQEWLADRVPGVQYPKVRRIQPARAGKPNLSIPARMVLFCLGIIGLVAGGALLAAGLFIIWIALRYLFS